MIKYKLSCKDCSKSYDSWFASSKEFEKLKKMNLINCETCNSFKIDKSVMSPRISSNLNSSKELKEVLETIGNEDEVSKEDIKDKQTAKTLKDLKKLSEEVKEEVTEEDEIDLENMLGGLMDSNIGSSISALVKMMKEQLHHHF